MAHKLAVVSEHVTGDVVEATEFPDMAQRYRIYGVPKVVINDRVEFEGALPEDRYVREVQRAVEEAAPGGGQQPAGRPG